MRLPRCCVALTSCLCACGPGVAGEGASATGAGTSAGETAGGGETEGEGAPPCDELLHYEGGAVVSNAAQLEALRCVRVLLGPLTISAPEVTDLSALSTLEHVWGRFEIHGCSALTSLDGLEALDEVHLENKDQVFVPEDGELSIHDNPLLADVSALAGVEHSSGVSFYNNPALTQIDIFHAGRVSWSFVAHDNDALERIAGFGGDDNVLNVLDLRNNAQLTEVEAFAHAAFAGAVLIEDNPLLERVIGMQEVTGLSRVVIERNPALVELDAFWQATFINGLSLHDNDSLTSLTNFAAIQEWNNQLSLCRNAALSQLWMPGPASDPPSNLVALGNAIPEAELLAFAAASGVPADAQLVDATPSDQLPHLDCPWQNDGRCDEPAYGDAPICDDPPCCEAPTGLCAPGSDPIDCEPDTPP